MVSCVYCVREGEASWWSCIVKSNWLLLLLLLLYQECHNDCETTKFTESIPSKRTAARSATQFMKSKGVGLEVLTAVVTSTNSPVFWATTHRKVKGKVVPELNQLSCTPWRWMWECMYRSPFSWSRWVDSFTPLPLYSRGKGPRYPLDRRLDDVEKWQFLSLSGLELHTDCANAAPCIIM
jgi:hypothetical protein